MSGSPAGKAHQNDIPILSRESSSDGRLGSDSGAAGPRRLRFGQRSSSIKVSPQQASRDEDSQEYFQQDGYQSASPAPQPQPHNPYTDEQAAPSSANPPVRQRSARVSSRHYPPSVLPPPKYNGNNNNGVITPLNTPPQYDTPQDPRTGHSHSAGPYTPRKNRPQSSGYGAGYGAPPVSSAAAMQRRSLSNDSKPHFHQQPLPPPQQLPRQRRQSFNSRSA